MRIYSAMFRPRRLPSRRPSLTARRGAPASFAPRRKACAVRPIGRTFFEFVVSAVLLALFALPHRPAPRPSRSVP